MKRDSDCLYRLEETSFKTLITQTASDRFMSQEVFRSPDVVVTGPERRRPLRVRGSVSALGGDFGDGTGQDGTPPPLGAARPQGGVTRRVEETKTGFMSEDSSEDTHRTLTVDGRKSVHPSLQSPW